MALQKKGKIGAGGFIGLLPAEPGLKPEARDE